MVKEGSMGGELADKVSEVVVVKVLGVAGYHRCGESIVRVLLEGNGSARREGVGVLVKLFDEEGPPFVKGPHGVVCRLDFGNVSGSDEVEKEIGRKNGCAGPL